MITRMRQLNESEKLEEERRRQEMRVDEDNEARKNKGVIQLNTSRKCICTAVDKQQERR